MGTESEFDLRLLTGLVLSIVIHLLVLNLLSDFITQNQSVKDNQKMEYQISVAFSSGLAEATEKSATKNSPLNEKKKDEQALQEEKEDEQNKVKQKKEVTTERQTKKQAKEAVSRTAESENSSQQQVEDVDVINNFSTLEEKTDVQQGTSFKKVKADIFKTEKVNLNFDGLNSTNDKSLKNKAEAGINKAEKKLARAKNESVEQERQRVNAKNRATTANRTKQAEETRLKNKTKQKKKGKDKVDTVDLIEDSGKNVTAPSLIGHQPPKYPEQMRKRGIEGQIKLKVLITKEGRVEKLKTVSSSGYRQLDQAAKKAVANWKFKAAKLKKNKINSWVLIPITFSLK